MVGVFQGGHGEAYLQLGAVRAWCARGAEPPPINPFFFHVFSDVQLFIPSFRFAVATAVVD